MSIQPLRSYHSEAVEGVAHGLYGTFQPIEGTDRGQDMCRVGALLSSCLEQFAVTAQLQERIQHLLLSVTCD